MINPRDMPDLAQRILAGDTRALARAATAIENGSDAARRFLDELAAHAGHATVVGITGPPGAGKSTLVAALVRTLRQAGRTVGIIAVDPTSRISGGAILGDRIRMQDHHADPGIFIRSMATRGATGGLARATADLVLLLDAAGKDYVIIETVGVGQDEVEIAALAHLTIVVLVPGMGDEIQAIKAGILEIADIFVINKADHPGADQVEREIQGNWDAVVVRTVATEGTGIAELAAEIAKAPRRRHATIDHLSGAAETLREALRQSGIRASLHHVSLAVADVPAAVEKLKSAGAEVVRRNGREYLRTGNVLLELIEERAANL